ncbi:putative bifunctional diguanylate cyclase/phosphodiesterase [Cellulomonas algicola]|uniref:putative bifunctional diguanylate cyclase/phosphodiesterase n=1 Tax=Cellulomonas algicola TaxID=2071633 RepID=UPI001C3F5125|nr:EAL domain-containing protein [Cellulomonas algicola]
MLGPVPVWVTVLQLLVAGLVAGFCVLHWLWRRGEARHPGAAWSLLWSADVALLLLVGGLFPLVPAGLPRDAVEVTHGLLVAGFLLIALPAAQAIGHGASVRWWVATATVLLVARTVSWFVPAPEAALVDVGCLLAAVLVVIVYVLVAFGRTPMGSLGTLLVIAGVESVAILLAGVLLPDEALSAILAALWAVPLAVGLEVLALRRLVGAQDTAARQHRMRDAVASLSNAAWFARDPERLLLTARDAARAVLDDDSIEGSLRPIARGRFVAELFPAEGTDLDPHARSFLVDLAQIVAAAGERYHLNDRLHATAFSDPLTTLPNRRAVEQHLVDVLDRANVERTRVAVVYCDVDGFKRVNDELGHARGDALLARVADHLRTVVTGEDVLVGRLGGDEFVAIVARAPEDAALVALARSLREGFEDRSHGGRPTRLTVGVATWVPGDVVDPDALVRHADTAMLEAKRSRSGFRVFDRALRRRVEAERLQRVALEEAVALGQFTAHFQPVVDTTTLEVLQVEALARWNHHGHLVLPADWLDLAEESGLIVPIGLAVLRESRRALDRFQMPVAVNVASRQLTEPDALEQFETAWGDSYWEHLTLEITESALVQTVQAVPVLSELRARGARVAVDDFGTGYSSISRLGRLPVDVLKIDRSFIRELGTERGRGAVRAILALAENHGLDVVAEGVETAAQLTTLVDLGVRRVQGNFLGRATPSLPVRGPRPVTEAIPVVTPAHTLRSVPTARVGR